MPTRADLLDTRGWFAARPRLDPPPQVEASVPRHAVIFLDRAGTRYGAPRPAQIDCLPARWTRLDQNGDDGYTQRTWVLTHGDAGPVYREQAPSRFVPTAYKPGGGVKGKRPRIIPDVEPANEEWA